MAQPQIFEGTSEQLTQWLRQRQNGKRYRIVEMEEDTTTIAKEPIQSGKSQSSDVNSIGTQPVIQRPSALGKYAFVPGGSEEFAREKQAEIEREDRPR